MIEIASFCFLIAIGEEFKETAKNPEIAEIAEEEVAEACKERTYFVEGIHVMTSSGLIPIEKLAAGGYGLQL